MNGLIVAAMLLPIVTVFPVNTYAARDSRNVFDNFISNRKGNSGQDSTTTNTGRNNQNRNNGTTSANSVNLFPTPKKPEEATTSARDPWRITPLQVFIEQGQNNKATTSTTTAASVTPKNNTNNNSVYNVVKNAVAVKPISPYSAEAVLNTFFPTAPYQTKGFGLATSITLMIAAFAAGIKGALLVSGKSLSSVLNFTNQS